MFVPYAVVNPMFYLSKHFTVHVNICFWGSASPSHFSSHISLLFASFLLPSYYPLLYGLYHFLNSFYLHFHVGLKLSSRILSLMTIFSWEEIYDNLYNWPNYAILQDNQGPKDIGGHIIWIYHNSFFGLPFGSNSTGHICTWHDGGPTSGRFGLPQGCVFYHYSLQDLYYLYIGVLKFA